MAGQLVNTAIKAGLSDGCITLLTPFNRAGIKPRVKPSAQTAMTAQHMRQAADPPHPGLDQHRPTANT
jgi:hypothetical protein